MRVACARVGGVHHKISWTPEAAPLLILSGTAQVGSRGWAFWLLHYHPVPVPRCKPRSFHLGQGEPDPKIPRRKGGLEQAQGLLSLLLWNEVKTKASIMKKEDTLVLPNSNALGAHIRSNIIFTFTRSGTHIFSAIKLQGAKPPPGFTVQAPTLCETLKYLSIIYLLILDWTL